MGIPDQVNKLLLQFTEYVVDTSFSVTPINSEAHVKKENSIYCHLQLQLLSCKLFGVLSEEIRSLH